jgi:hypothetical protein
MEIDYCCAECRGGMRCLGNLSWKSMEMLASSAKEKTFLIFITVPMNLNVNFSKQNLGEKVLTKGRRNIKEGYLIVRNATEIPERYLIVV